MTTFDVNAFVFQIALPLPVIVWVLYLSAKHNFLFLIQALSSVLMLVAISELYIWLELPRWVPYLYFWLLLAAPCAHRRANAVRQLQVYRSNDSHLGN